MSSFRLDCAVYGAARTGKTALVRELLQGKPIISVQDAKQSLSVDVFLHELKDMAPESGTFPAIFLVYDATNRSTYDYCVDFCRQRFNDSSLIAATPIRYLVGTHRDCVAVDLSNRAVLYQDAEQFATQYGMKWLEVAATRESHLQNVELLRRLFKISVVYTLARILASPSQPNCVIDMPQSSKNALLKFAIRNRRVASIDRLTLPAPLRAGIPSNYFSFVGRIIADDEYTARSRRSPATSEVLHLEPQQIAIERLDDSTLTVEQGGLPEATAKSRPQLNNQTIDNVSALASHLSLSAVSERSSEPHITERVNKSELSSEDTLPEKESSEGVTELLAHSFASRSVAKTLSLKENSVSLRDLNAGAHSLIGGSIDDTDIHEIRVPRFRKSEKRNTRMLQQAAPSATLAVSELTRTESRVSSNPQHNTSKIVFKTNLSDILKSYGTIDSARASATISPRRAKTQRCASSGSTEGMAPVIFIEVEVGDRVCGLHVHRDDNAFEVASAFVQEHGINPQYVQVLTPLIQSRIKEYLSIDIRQRSLKRCTRSSPTPASYISDKRRDQALLFRLEVDLGTGRAGVITVREGDIPQKLAEEFIRTYGLKKETYYEIVERLQSELSRIHLERYSSLSV